MTDPEQCKHENTHPGKCDDCGGSWCDVCLSYHREPVNSFDCSMALRDEIAGLKVQLTHLRKGRGQLLAMNSVWMRFASYLSRNGHKDLVDTWLEKARKAASDVRDEDFVRARVGIGRQDGN